MATHPLGKETKNIGVNVRKTLKADLEQLAKESGLSLSYYCRLVLQDAKNKKIIFAATTAAK